MTFDHGVPAVEKNPMVLQITILEMEQDDGLYVKNGIFFSVDPTGYAGIGILAVPRCCQERRGNTDRVRINSGVQTRDALRTGNPWETGWDKSRSAMIHNASCFIAHVFAEC